MDSNADSDFLFPDFAQKINSGGKDINSKTANLFNHYAEWLNNISYDYSEYSMMSIKVSLNSKIVNSLLFLRNINFYNLVFICCAFQEIWKKKKEVLKTWIDI